MVDGKQPKEMDRRRFIKNTGILAGGVVGGSLLGGLITNQMNTKPDATQMNNNDENSLQDARMFFSRWEDFNVLRHASERIYPKDDSGPGAIELGVPYFIDKQLAGAWGVNSKEYMLGPFILDEREKKIPKEIREEQKQSQGGPDAETQPSVPLPRYESGLNRGEIFIQGLRKIEQVSNKKFNDRFDRLETDDQDAVLHLFDNGEIPMEGFNSKTFFHLLLQATIEGVYSDPLYGGNKNMQGWKMKEYPGPRPGYIDLIQEEDFVIMDPFSLREYQQS